MKYESTNSYQSKDMADVQVFADKQTDRPKTTFPDLSMRGHKNHFKGSIYKLSTVRKIFLQKEQVYTTV